MGTKTIDPQSIRNVTLIGHPADTTQLIHRMRLQTGIPGSGPQISIPWSTDRIEYTIRITELSGDAPMAELERSIRVADGLVVVLNAAHPAARLETVLRVADDHQVARLCLITALYRPDANFDRTLRDIAGIHGAVPLPLQLPHGTGPEFEGVIDLPLTWHFRSTAATIYGPHWPRAEHAYRHLIHTITDNPALPQDLSLPDLDHRIRAQTRIGDIVPTLCCPHPRTNGTPGLLDAIARYLPSPLDVCQPEHALDY